MSKETRISISQECKRYNQICGANKNLYRTIPSMIDGLKPGARRLMYTLYSHYDRKQRSKVAEIAGSVLKLHPHGNVAVEDTLIGLGQFWANNVCLIDGKGNFGSPKGSAAAAGRYIEARMSDYAWRCFFEDFKSSNVDMKLTYTGRDYEPVNLPARYPHALLNGTLGIGYGLSSNIPPYNITEVFQSVIKLIKEGPDINITLVPDSPSGCYILDDGQFDEISKSGLGTYRMRAVVDVDDKQNTVTIRNCPYQMTSNQIVDKIIDMRDSDKTKWVKNQLIDIRDLSNFENGVKVILKLSQDVNPYEFLEKLYKKDTGLEKTYPVNMVLIDDYTAYDYNIKSFLLDWLCYRRELKQNIYNFKLTDALSQQHINDILLFILNSDNGDKTLKMAQGSASKSEFCDKLMKTYAKEVHMTSLQASSIADMRIQSFTKEAYEGYKTRKYELKDEIAKYEKILKDPSYVDKDIVEELEDGIKRYGGPRKSKILNMIKKKHVADTVHIVAINQKGICKKLPIEEGCIGTLGNNDVPCISLKANNKDTLLVFDTQGNVGRIAVASLPDTDVNDSGVPISRYYSGIGDIISIIKEDHDINNSCRDVVMITKQGYVKATKWDEFNKLKTAKCAIKLSDDDQLVETLLIHDNESDLKLNKKESLLIYTNKGNGLRIAISDIPVYGINSKGLRQISMRDGEYLISATHIPAKADYLLYCTCNGEMKLTELAYLPIMDRKSDAVNLINIDDKRSLAFISVVNKNDSVTIYKKSSDPVQMRISDIPVLTRVSKPKKLISVSKGDTVAGIKIN